MDFILKYMFPNSLPGDWELQDDGEGPYISQWNRQEPKPTPIEIASATPAAQAALSASEKAAVLSEFRALRDTALARLNGIQMDSTAQGDIDAIKAAKQGLKDMPQHASVVAAIGGDATEDALQALWASIAMQLYQSAPSAYTAFRGLDM